MLSAFHDDLPVEAWHLHLVSAMIFFAMPKHLVPFTSVKSSFEKAGTCLLCCVHSDLPQTEASYSSCINASPQYAQHLPSNLRWYKQCLQMADIQAQALVMDLNNDGEVEILAGKLLSDKYLVRATGCNELN